MQPLHGLPSTPSPLPWGERAGWGAFFYGEDGKDKSRGKIARRKKIHPLNYDMGFSPCPAYPLVIPLLSSRSGKIWDQEVFSPSHKENFHEGNQSLRGKSKLSLTETKPNGTYISQERKTEGWITGTPYLIKIPIKYDVPVILYVFIFLSSCSRVPSCSGVLSFTQ